MRPRPLAPVVLVALLAAAPAARAGKANDIRMEEFKLLNEGVAAYNKGDFKAAIPALEKCANEGLNSFRAYYFLGLAYTGDRRYADAVEALKIALDLDPNHLQANVALGDAWLAQGNLEEASPSYYEALKLRAEYPAALDGLARIAEAQADDDKAIGFYGRALAMDKAFAPAYMHLGDLDLRRGKLDDAVKLLVEAVSVRPDFAAALNRLASAYGRLGFSNEAVATIRKAIELEPKNAEHRATLGDVLLGMGVVAGAEGAYREAIAQDAGQPQAHAGLAEIARRRGDFGGATAEIDRALADKRLDHRMRDDLTKRRAAIAAEGERSATLEAAVTGGSATPGDRVALAGLLAAREDWGRAADVLAVADPQGADRERLAYYFFRAGRFHDAHAIYAEIAKVGARADVEVNDGAALARMGDDAKAAEAFARALAIDANQPQAQIYSANVLLRLGRRADATALYEKYLDANPDGASSEQVRRVLAELKPRAPAPPPPAVTPPAAPAAADKKGGAQ